MGARAAASLTPGSLVAAAFPQARAAHPCAARLLWATPWPDPLSARPKASAALSSLSGAPSLSPYSARTRVARPAYGHSPQAPSPVPSSPNPPLIYFDLPDLVDSIIMLISFY